VPATIIHRIAATFTPARDDQVPLAAAYPDRSAKTTAPSTSPNASRSSSAHRSKATTARASAATLTSSWSSPWSGASASALRSCGLGRRFRWCRWPWAQAKGGGGLGRSCHRRPVLWRRR